MKLRQCLPIVAALWAAFFVSGAAQASRIEFSGPPRIVISALPGSPTNVFTYVVTDAVDQDDCTVGTGTSYTGLTICKWNGSAWVAVGSGGGGGLGTDTVGTSELDDGADTPGAGDFVRVATATTDVEYSTPAEALTAIGAQPADADLDDLADGTLSESAIDPAIARDSELSTTDAGTVTHLTGQTDDFAIGGTDSSAPFFFDEDTGELTLNVAGAGITTTPHATDGSTLQLSEGADDGSNTFTLKVPDSGLTQSTVCTISADGRIPEACMTRGGSPLTVLNVMDPPPGSGLSVPAGIASGVIDTGDPYDGTDGNGSTQSAVHASSIDAAPTINAAITYACANGYDVVFAPTGNFRVGADVTSAGYSAIHVDAGECPRGIRLIGAGPGRSVILPRARGGGYQFASTDEWTDNANQQQLGANVLGIAPGDEDVTAFSNATPPVITFDADTGLRTGDTVFIRNCSGNTEVNEKTFTVQACTTGSPFTCDLHDIEGVAVDGSALGTWSATPNECIIHKIHPEFYLEIAGFTWMDDDPYAHMQTSGNPLVSGSEEIHHMSLRHSGGITHIHHNHFPLAGDEALDGKIAEGQLVIENNVFGSAAHGAVAIYSGVGIKIQNNLFDYANPNDHDTAGTGSATALATGAFTAIDVDPGATNRRISGLEISGNIFRGHWQTGIYVQTNATGLQGTYIDGVSITDNVVVHTPRAGFCDEVGVDECRSVDVRGLGGPIRNVAVRNNVLRGELNVDGDDTEIVVIDGNHIRPIETSQDRWGINLRARHAKAIGNDVADFRRGCIGVYPYNTQGGSNTSMTATIEGNTLECLGSATNPDPVIGIASTGSPAAPHADDEGFLNIIENSIRIDSSSFNAEGIEITQSMKNVRIAENTVLMEQSANARNYGIRCDTPACRIEKNNIDAESPGIYATSNATGARIIENNLDGQGTGGRGIQVQNIGDVKIVDNEIADYTISGIDARVTTGTTREVFRIRDNDLRNTGDGIKTLSTSTGDVQIVTISGNTIDLAGGVNVDAISLDDTIDAVVSKNIASGLGTGEDLLLTTGRTDYVSAFGNIGRRTSGADSECVASADPWACCTGAGTGTCGEGPYLRHGTTAGGLGCSTTGAVGANSICGDTLWH